jgi:hypothetical protein
LIILLKDFRIDVGRLGRIGFRDRLRWGAMCEFCVMECMSDDFETLLDDACMNYRKEKRMTCSD